LLGPRVRRFLPEHLVGERNLARNTQQSYRDALRLFLPFAARAAGRPIDRLRVEDLTAERVRAFLHQMEEKRGCAAATRNQRLAAIHSLAHFIGLRSPEHVAWCGEVRSVPFKKAARPVVTYLEKDEMDALLAAPDGATPQGRRDHVLLLFLYNTGARADEAAQVCIPDLALGRTPSRDPSSVLIRGKGNKQRRCPPWPRTVQGLLEVKGGEEHKPWREDVGVMEFLRTL
jgi:site-specific recombinase XerD